MSRASTNSGKLSVLDYLSRVGALKSYGGISKRMMIIIAVSTLLVIGGASTYFILQINHFTDTNQTGNQPQTDSPPTSILPKPVVDAITAANLAVADQAKQSGSTTAKQIQSGIAVYDKAINDNEDQNIKAALFMKQAEFYSFYNDYKSAIVAVTSAQDITGKTLETTTTLALLYEQAGDYKDAASYYKDAAFYVVKEAGDTDGNTYDPEQDAEYYKSKATEMESKQ